MEEELLRRLEKQEHQLDEIYSTVKRLKRYFLTTLIISAVTFILPILGLIISIPWILKFIETMESSFNGLI